MTLEESYRYCADIARSRARNFYYSFVLLDKPRKRAMCAMYAFMRYCDDLSDEPGANLAAISRWRADLAQALDKGFADGHPLWPAFLDSVRRYRIPPEYFYEMIEGVSSDIEPRAIGTFDELYKYCYQVASVVGLTIIHIFGFDTPEALPLAEKCGIAFQLTNILRDIREDAERGRVYLPREDLDRFGVDPVLFRAAEPAPAFRDMMRFEAARARGYYNESAPLVPMVQKRSQSSLWALIEIYSRLLARIEARNYDVLSSRVRLSSIEKAAIVLRATVR